MLIIQYCVFFLIGYLETYEDELLLKYLKVKEAK